ncbi:alpha/beta hydrolase [Erythrobacter sp. WH158]|uniref:Alpha/beta hydrolase n=2 Tax=Erythrobacter crassostreae TaxID=2828328 RepID=A0A9X1F579_9SPHN|nr:alpha/beta hydrolase [Erythrobacter crassostrea]
MKPSGPKSWTPDVASGISIDFVEAGELTFEVAKAGEGDHLALCLHGFPELHFSWRHQMPLLAEMGYRVWAPNLRGYGGTSRPEGVRNYAMDKLTGDVAALIKASGAEKVTLFAHDWGAIIAWAYAIAHKPDLDRLVIMNVPHPQVAMREIKQWRQLKKSWYIYFFQLPWVPEKMLGRGGGQTAGRLIEKISCNRELFGPEVQAIYNKAAMRKGARTAMVNYYRALLRHRGTLNMREFGVQVPTLMLWGEEDVALNIHCTEGTEEWVPDFTLKRFPGVSHWVQQDAPEAVNAALKDWLPGA